MKKVKKSIILIFVILTVAAAAFSLTACNSATTQGQLADILSSHSLEVLTYKVTDEANDIEGVYEAVLKRYDAGATIENFGDATLSNVSAGILVTGNLKVGTTVYQTGCYYNLISDMSYMVPAYTYRMQSEGGEVKFKLQGSYDGATLNYSLTKDGKTTKGSLDTVAPFYDNNEFQQSLRAITNFSTGLSFAFNVPVVASDEIENMKLSALCTSTEKIKTDWTQSYKKDSSGDESAENMPYKADGINCYVVTLSRDTKVNGSSQKLYYAVDDISINGWAFTHVPVKFVEPAQNGDIVYTLTNVQNRLQTI